MPATHARYRIAVTISALALSSGFAAGFAVAQTSPRESGKTVSPSAQGDVSQQEKMNACRNLAQKKNLSGKDEKSFIKDCIQKANPSK